MSANQGRAIEEAATGTSDRYVRGGRLRRAMQSPETARLYAELAHEDVVLAEAGIEDYAAMLAQSDRSPDACSDARRAEG